MLEAQPLVEVHGVGDGVVPLEGDHRQGEHRQLGAQHPEEARHLAGYGQLPLDRIFPELAQCRGVQHCQES